MRWFEDLEPEAEFEIGAFTFTAEDIVGFARQFDPQPFHLSEEGTIGTPFERLAASGWQTAAVWMQVMVARMKTEARACAARGEPFPAFGPSPGFEDMKWLRPVYAGDTVSFRSRVEAKRASASRPGWGLATFRHFGFNQAGDRVFEFTGNVFVPMRGA